MIRFAIWTAVSLQAQAAPDKVSLDDQQAVCRKRALAAGWQETAGPFVVPGQSRTRWVNLRDAEDAIPALRQMLDAAKRREFELLVLYDYTRLRELLDPVARSLAAYGVQLYSVSQPVEPLPPDQFDPYATDAASIVQTVSTLTSRAEINALRRRWRIGVPRRVEKGLHTLGRIPYGYRKPPGRELDHSAVFVQDPIQAAVLLEIKDLFLSGRSLAQIAVHLETKAIPSPAGRPRWCGNSIRYALTSRFYAGSVHHGGVRKLRDPRTGQVRQVKGDPDKIISGPGLHQPLWDEDTRQAILAELRRRKRRYKGRRSYRLSLLLRCAEHDRTLRVQYRQDGNHRWYCSVIPGKWHMFAREHDLIERLACTLTADLRAIQDRLPRPKDPDRSGLLRAALDDLRARRERLTDALEAGGLDPLTYAARVRTLDQRIAQSRTDLDNEDARQHGRQHRLAGLAAIVQAIEAAPDFLASADPQEVNAALRSLIEKVLVTDEGPLEIVYR